ncbi:MAG: hypothetical protein LBT53_04005, partial [Puniceicoccales bacterium]|nr:hypothetical protein [Puniceicoccales bacterium]
APALAHASSPTPSAAYRLDWRLAGRLSGELFLFEAGASLVVLNLRAARVRIWYERILRRFADNAPVAQQLLLPVPLELDPLASSVLREGLATLTRAGFQIEEFGRNFFRILAIPDWLGDNDTAGQVRDIIASLGRHTGEFQRKNMAHELLAKLAGERAAGVGNAKETVSDALATDTVRDLFLCGQPTVTPAGKPVFFELTRAEITRRFGG